MACLQNYQEQLSIATFCRVHSDWTEVTYLPWQNKYLNLKRTSHIQKIFFACELTPLRTQLLIFIKLLISIPSAPWLIERWENSAIWCSTIAVTWSCSNSVIWYSNLIEFLMNSPSRHLFVKSQQWIH